MIAPVLSAAGVKGPEQASYHTKIARANNADYYADGSNLHRVDGQVPSEPTEAPMAIYRLPPGPAYVLGS